MKFTDETLKRALKTFFQAVIAYVIVALKSGVDFNDGEAVKTFVIGLIAAGLAAIMNLEKKEIGGEGDTLFYLNQNDYEAVSYNKPDGTAKNIKTSGCGVVSACIAFNTLAGREILSVEETAKTSKNCGARTNNGTDEKTLLNQLCRANKGFSLKCSNDVNALTKHLKSGGAAICNQGDAYNVFSTAGHYIVAYKYEGGKIYVADPSNTDTKYDKFSRPKRIIKKTSSGCIVKPAEMKKATSDRNPAYYLISYKEAEKRYFKKCGKDEKSISDALVCAGADGSFAYRKRIAAANGIKHYVGSSGQNIKLLKLLKKGVLIKP